MLQRGCAAALRPFSSLCFSTSLLLALPLIPLALSLSVVPHCSFFPPPASSRFTATLATTHHSAFCTLLAAAAPSSHHALEKKEEAARVTKPDPLTARHTASVFPLTPHLPHPSGGRRGRRWSKSWRAAPQRQRRRRTTTERRRPSTSASQPTPRFAPASPLPSRSCRCARLAGGVERASPRRRRCAPVFAQSRRALFLSCRRAPRRLCGSPASAVPFPKRSPSARLSKDVWRCVRGKGAVVWARLTPSC